MRVESSGGLPELEDSRWAPRDAGAHGRRRRQQRRPRRGAGAPEPMAAPATAVQRLFEACREVFTGAGPGAVPPPAGVERIKSVLVTAIDLRTMKKASVLALQNHRILSCEMLPSKWLICTGMKDKALLWDIRKAQELPNTVVEMQSDGPVTLLHLDQYKVVIGVPSDGQVHVWETRTGDLLNTLGCGEPSRSGVQSRVSAMAVDGCRIAMAGSSPEGSVLHYRDFTTSSAPVSLPGKEKEVSRFWRPQQSEDSEDDSEEEDF